MAKTVELECAECGKTFEKAKGEYDRQVREGRDPDHFFCSLSCSCAYGNHKNPNKADTEHLDPGNLRDQYSPFRYFVRKARERSKEYDIDVQYLKKLWKKQDGRGVYTGWKLDNPPSTYAREKADLTPRTASLDRIDSNKGYMKGNVQFVAYIANVAKDSFDGEDLIEFCKAVAENNE